MAKVACFLSGALFTLACLFAGLYICLIKADTETNLQRAWDAATLTKGAITLHRAGHEGNVREAEYTFYSLALPRTCIKNRLWNLTLEAAYKLGGGESDCFGDIEPGNSRMDDMKR